VGSSRCLLSIALVAALSCGKNAEEERFDEVRAICDSLVGQTVGQAVERLGQLDGYPGPWVEGACVADLTAWNARDTCAYDGATDVCDGGGWNFWSNDPDRCSGAGCVMQPDGFCRPVRCWFGCLIRYAAGDVTPSEDPAVRDATPICASRFVSREQNPPVHF
jgi:hypothetical protein